MKAAAVPAALSALAAANRAAAFVYAVYALGLPLFQDTLLQLTVGSSTGAMLTLIHDLRILRSSRSRLRRQ